MNFSTEINELTAALSLFQMDAESPKRSSANPAFKRDGKALKYADLDAIIKVVTPALSKHGLSQIQFTSTNVEAQTVTIKTFVFHSSGQFMQGDDLVLPGDNFGKFNAQTIGSAITYGRRYSLSAILGIASEDDDDANTQTGAGSEEPPEKKTYNKPTYQNKKQPYNAPKNVPDDVKGESNAIGLDARESALIAELDEKVQSVANKINRDVEFLKEYTLAQVNKSKNSKFPTFEKLDKSTAIGTLKLIEMRFDKKVADKAAAAAAEAKQGEMFEEITTNPAADIFGGKK